MRAWSLIFIGLMLSVTGFMLPFLMVMHRIPSTYFINLFSYLSQISGLMLGIIGASLYVQKRRK